MYEAVKDLKAALVYLCRENCFVTEMMPSENPEKREIVSAIFSEMETPMTIEFAPQHFRTTCLDDPNLIYSMFNNFQLSCWSKANVLSKADKKKAVKAKKAVSKKAGKKKEELEIQKEKEEVDIQLCDQAPDFESFLGEESLSLQKESEKLQPDIIDPDFPFTLCKRLH